MNEQKLEQQIINKGLTAPRVTPDDLDAEIVGEEYYNFPGTTVTICLLTLKNKYNLVGESACASTENFDEEIGMQLAKDNAKNKLWGLLGFRLRDKLEAEADSFAG